ncbi:MAG: homoserine dehydrogenase [Sedimentisphaerales bacterium]|nr:homoserine dehydrogenase [Sedimentisphaerales bacterium]
MNERIVKVGLVGFGTIGSGVAKLILEDADSIAARIGIRPVLACVVDIDTTTERPVKLPEGILTNDLNRLLGDKSIEIGIELIGGTTVAKQVQIKMLQAGKDVVTANKALLAEHGSELYNIAKQNGRCIAFEASCAGGIPLISSIRSGLTANNISGIYGIVNGTCNYILSSMTAYDEEFSDALAQAQKKGYAEPNPTLDISGSDSAHKLAILSSIAFGYEITIDDIYCEGIESISKFDIQYGSEMGYCLKLLAIATRCVEGVSPSVNQYAGKMPATQEGVSHSVNSMRGQDARDTISLRVHPSFISKDNHLARVGGPFNAISLFGSATGQVMFYGRGAGMMPTASAVVADIIDVALGNSKTTFFNLAVRKKNENAIKIETIDNLICRFYIRIMCKDRPGVIAQWSKVLAEHNISISGALQHEEIGPDNTVPVVIVTHPTLQKSITAALEDMEKLDSVRGKPFCIRIVDIPEDKD